VRKDRRYRGRRNLVSRTPGTGGGRSLLLSGHVDTVPPGRAPWKHGGPFSGAVSGGKLYGRGSWDMKGGLVAQFAVAAALKRAGARLRGDLVCESIVDEEFGGGGGTLAGRLRGDQADACAVAEGTNYEVIRATRGGCVFDVICEAGDPMGYFSREEVVSPAVPMGRVLGWVDGWVARRKRVERSAGPYADFPDPAPVQVLAVEANTFDREVPWSVPCSGGSGPTSSSCPARTSRRCCARSRRRSTSSREATPSSGVTRCASSACSTRRSTGTSSRPTIPGPRACSARRGA
jgi:acetylornithine deacetylase